MRKGNLLKDAKPGGKRRKEADDVLFKREVVERAVTEEVKPLY